MKTPKLILATIAGTVIGAAGFSALPEKIPEPIIEISISATEEIIQLELEMKEREEAGLSTTIQFQKIQELKQRLNP